MASLFLTLEAGTFYVLVAFYLLLAIPIFRRQKSNLVQSINLPTFALTLFGVIGAVTGIIFLDAIRIIYEEPADSGDVGSKLMPLNERLRYVRAQRDYWLSLSCMVMGVVINLTLLNLRDYASVKTALKKTKSQEIPPKKVQ
ncbi:hypothetical protein M427DRAFT_30682 [Gonapodya prolifera JEL478]|uniref:BAP29/BAP31 transmembrane domain-containing protein n=1 Tax=Gonapodya prolifera (strain JEL478) TaxID=1344416 RepID=A0A139AL23_GONPJ|nr:hypothetical protein M427DRAFT_30682 [Gonapodya prolifera JEL478]|eukprot:KXS17224.1 hypothetical protein M427DRAFT_30682 [Gonapodya prolifera JEL478]